MKTIKAILAVTIAPVLLTVAFHSNQIKTVEVSRKPAVIEKMKVPSVKESLKAHLIVGTRLY